MAYSTGTATSHTDLWTKLLTFLTTDSSLVAAGQAWTIAWTAPSGSVSPSDTILVGPGTAGQDQIYVGIRHSEDAGADSYYFEVRGLTGISSNSSVTTLADHVGPSSPKRMFVDPGAMKYWFVANGRRFVVLVRISTVFEAMYAGMFLPYALPTSYPYPVFIGASAGNKMSSSMNWRSTGVGHNHFPFSNVTFSGGLVTDERSATMIDPLGQWRQVSVTCTPSGSANTDIGVGPMWFYETSTAMKVSSIAVPGYESIRGRMREAFGGTYVLTPMTLIQVSPDDQTFGVLDGCFEVSGFGNSSENIITFGGVDHLVVQNAFRTTRDQYWALALE